METTAEAPSRALSSEEGFGEVISAEWGGRICEPRWDRRS